MRLRFSGIVLAIAAVLAWAWFNVGDIPNAAIAAQDPGGQNTENDDLFGDSSSSPEANASEESTQGVGDASPISASRPTPTARSSRGRIVGPASGVAAMERIEGILESSWQTPLEYAAMPLNLVLQEIADAYNLPIVFDQRELTASDAPVDQEIDLNLSAVTLRAGLQMILGQVGLAYVVEDEVLCITTHDAAESRLEVRIYEVDDMSFSVAPAADHPPYEELQSLIQKIVVPETWTDSGEGRLFVLAQGLPVVRQTQDVHHQIEALLTALRSMKDEALSQ